MSCAPALPFLLSIPVMLTHPFSCIKLMFIRAFTELIQFINPGANNSLFCHVSFLPGQWVESISLRAWWVLDLLPARGSRQPGAGATRWGRGTGYPQMICCNMLLYPQQSDPDWRRLLCSPGVKPPAAALSLKLPAVCHKPLLQPSEDPDSQQGGFEPNLILFALAFHRVSLMHSQQLPLLEKCTLQLSLFPNG